MRLPRFLHLIPLCTAGLTLLHAAEMQNAGFESSAGWTSNGGSLLAGSAGGNGWGTGYFNGGYPTNNTFASTIGGPVRQNLTGSGNTFVEGATYTVSMKIFGPTTYADGASIMWSLGLTADGGVVAIDHWFSEEFNASRVGAGNGGTIPDDHVTTVASGSTGLKTVTLSYTATADDDGKLIGIRLGGDTQSKYTLAAGAPTADDYYGMMDSVTFSSNATASLVSFNTDKTLTDGAPVTLSWSIENPGLISTLTLDDGTDLVDVKSLTDISTGLGSTTVNPTANTTYKLTLDDASTRQVTVLNGKVLAYTSSVRIANAPSFQTTLNWEVRPLGANVTLSDGTNTIDVTADTSATTGIGSRVITVPAASTNFTLNVNNGSATATKQVLRAGEDSSTFSLNSHQIATGTAVTVTWNGTGAASGSWIGIYSVDQTPGTDYAITWQYIGGPSGSMNFTLPNGNYYAVLFVDGAYTIEHGPLAFTVAVPPPPTIEIIKVESIHKNGSNLTIVWDSKAGHEYDIYASDSLEGNPLADWEKISSALPSEGDGSTSYTENLGANPPPRRFYRIYEYTSAP